MIASLESKLVEVNAEYERVEKELAEKKREMEPIEAKLQVIAYRDVVVTSSSL